MNKKQFLVGLAAVTTVGMVAAPSAQAQTTQTINGDFESNSVSVRDNTFRLLNPELVEGWQTTDRAIEIWGDKYNGVEAASGSRFAEINAHIDGILYQDLTGIDAGKQIDFSFYHRARVGTDVMNFAITDLGADNLFGSDDDTVLFAKDYSATTAGWVLNDNSNEETIFSLGNNVRVSYAAVSTGSRNSSVGNFLDDARIGVSSNPRPVPYELESSLGLLMIGGVITYRKLKSKVKASQPLVFED